MRSYLQRQISQIGMTVFAVWSLWSVGPLGATDTRQLDPLPVTKVQVQGLHRVVRIYRPKQLAEHPHLLLVLHGSAGDGERFRHFH